MALVIVRETEHRIGAIRQLRWSDIDTEARTIRWRAEDEKTGYAQAFPVRAGLWRRPSAVIEVRQSSAACSVPAVTTAAYWAGRAARVAGHSREAERRTVAIRGGKPAAREEFALLDDHRDTATPTTPAGCSLRPEVGRAHSWIGGSVHPSRFGVAQSRWMRRPVGLSYR